MFNEFNTRGFSQTELINMNASVWYCVREFKKMGYDMERELDIMQCIEETVFNVYC